MNIFLFFTGLTLGIQHALEPDHIATISSLTAKKSRFWAIFRIGIFWSIGHASVISIGAIILFRFRTATAENFGDRIDQIIGLYLLYLGGRMVWKVVKEEKKNHSHSDKKSNTNKKNAYSSFLIGILHGLAGTGTLAVILLSEASSQGENIFFVVSFAIGSIVGMLTFTAFLSAPLVWLSKHTQLKKFLYLSLVYSVQV